MIWIKNIITILKNNKNIVTFLVAGIIIAFMSFQCSRINSLKDKAEAEKRNAEIIQNNWEASMDSVSQWYDEKEKKTKAEISGYTYTIDELEKKNKKLFNDYKYEKNKPPLTITKTVIDYKDTLFIPVKVDTDSNGTTISFVDSVIYDDYNFRVIKGNLPVSINAFDSSNKELKNIRYSVSADKLDFNINQGISLTTGLFKDPDNGKIKIRTETGYPGITFTDIQGAYIMENEESKKIAKGLRKPMGVGLNIGYGANFSGNQIIWGPQISVGLNITPKILQFGK
jgi:translation initiation factor 1 (eIF-1/SUI1)